MDEQKIETLLKKAPAPKAPDGLVNELLADIHVPRGTTASAARSQWTAPVPLWKRWMPALSFAVILLTCMVALAVQTNVMNGLTRENEGMRTAAQSIDDLRKENADLKQVQNETDELGRLRKDAAELAKLQEEVATLAGQVGGLDKLRADNAQLQAAIAAKQAAAGQSDENVLLDARQKAQSQMCINNLKQIGVAFRLWADDNNDIYPRDFISMTNELSNWKILQCPADRGHNVAGWDQVRTGDVSYRLMSTARAVHVTEPNVVLAECPIHGHVVLADGSVQSGVPKVRASLSTKDGVTILDRTKGNQ